MLHNSAIVIVTLVAFLASGLAAYVSWHFNKALFDLFPLPPVQEERGVVEAFIGAVTGFIETLFITFATIMMVLCVGGLLAAACIASAICLPMWAIVPVGLAAGLLPITVVCAGARLAIFLCQRFHTFFERLAVVLSDLASLFTGALRTVFEALGSLCDAIGTLFTDLPLFLERVAARSERAGNSIRRSISG